MTTEKQEADTNQHEMEDFGIEINDNENIPLKREPLKENRLVTGWVFKIIVGLMVIAIAALALAVKLFHKKTLLRFLIRSWNSGKRLCCW